MTKQAKLIYNGITDVCRIWVNEIKTIFGDEGVLIFVILLPLAYPVLYSWIYNNQVVREVPVAVVDNSNTALSRKFIQMCDASPDVRVAGYCTNLDNARQMVGEQQAYGVIYLPQDFDTRIGRMQQSTVSVYCNMGIMLTYKAIFQTVSAVAAEMNSIIQISLSGNYTDREDLITTAPLDIKDVPMFNSTGGYADFILPGVLALIIQQVLLLGIGLANGTSTERRRYIRLRPILDRPLGLLRIVLAKTMAYAPIAALMIVYVLLVVPRMFGLVQILHGEDMIHFGLPYALACIFFAMCISYFFHERESAILFIVFTSVPLLFMSGISWPGSNIPEFWKAVSYLFPSTFGIQGFIKMNTMGATIDDIKPEGFALWIQTIVYFLIACVAEYKRIDAPQKVNP